MEAWLSGLKRLVANQLYESHCTEGSNPSASATLRRIMSILRELEGHVDMTCEKIGMPLKDVRMLELGNQRMGVWDRPDYYKPYKQVLMERGIKEHISVDWNGEDGALKIDLSKELTDWQNYFDIVTNFGTAEHVDNQYMVYKNIHNMCRIGGAILHFVPPVGDWPRHCPYRYRHDFFKVLAFYNQYEIAYEEKVLVTNPNPRKNRHLFSSILIKKDNPFMLEQDFLNMGTIHGLPSYKEG